MCPQCNKRIGNRQVLRGWLMQTLKNFSCFNFYIIIYRGAFGLTHLGSTSHSVFAVFPNGMVVHYFCKEKMEQHRWKLGT
jgi:hypothetical protein